VLKEQQVFCEDHSHLDDVYHPDVSVRSTTQHSLFSSTSTYAGVAAAAGELAKDQKHQNDVEETGWGVILFLWW